MVSILAAALLVRSLQPVQELPIPAGTDAPRHAYARDGQFEYLATPAGLYRSPRLATSPPALLAFPGEGVNAVAAANGELIVAKGGGIEASTSPGHTLVRSANQGQSFTPIDAGLLDCAAGPCEYLVPTRLDVADGRIVVNAGGNVLVSADSGASWHQLYGLQYQGKPTSQMCPVKFELAAERRLFLGGECPLDDGWLRRGTLNASLTAWAEEPRDVDAPELENRNVQFIHDAGGGVVFAGIEGALLKSTDGGASFRFVIHYPIESAEKYPYIGHLVITPSVMIAGGWDKKDLVGYLAYSTDGGETWRDVSSLVGSPYVTLLAEDADGRLLAGLQDRDRFTLAEVILGEARKRRAVR